MQGAVSQAKALWSQALDAALAECHWPLHTSGQNPEPPGAWRGLAAAPPASAAAADTAFVGLLALQAASRFPRDFKNLAGGASGPWSLPELWAVRALAAPQLAALEALFYRAGGDLVGGLHGTELLFQRATAAMDIAVQELGAFQAPLDASYGQDHGYDVQEQLVRSMHAAVCDLVLQLIPPEIAATEGEEAMHAWLGLADASHVWELTVRLNTSHLKTC